MRSSNFFDDHPQLTAVLVALCLWISACLIIRMWLVHRRARFAKKLCWSITLLVPLFGWLMYAAFFTIPSRQTTDPGFKDAGAAGSDAAGD